VASEIEEKKNIKDVEEIHHYKNTSDLQNATIPLPENTKLKIE
jgi:hypothetical protein